MNSSIEANFQNVSDIANTIRGKINIIPAIGIICGSGLGKIADAISNKTIIPYSDIPNFPCTTVKGHKGNLVFGILGEKSVVAMQGRFHGYEGYTKDQITIPIRVMKLLGVHTLLISNAAGGINRQLKLCDLVIIKDHISFPSLSMQNVLIGPNHEEFGERFIAVSDAYDSTIRKLALKVAEENKFSDIMHEGVYAHCGGPTYESPAEIKMFLMLGADIADLTFTTVSRTKSNIFHN